MQSAKVRTTGECFTNLIWNASARKHPIVTSDLWNNASESCKFAIDNVVEGLAGSELWALEMFDASTKVPNGIFTGNLNDLGNFDECLRVQSPDGTFRGQFCQATFSSPFSNASANSLDYEARMKWSYCIPSTCSAFDLETALKNILQSSTINVTVGESDCFVERSTPWSTATILSIVLCSIVLILCVVSSLYDMWLRHFRGTSRPEKEKDMLLTSFSFYTNGERLFNLNESTDTMKLLHGMRFLSIAWIVLLHRYFFTLSTPIMNFNDVIKTTLRVDSQLILNGGVAVETFFFLSGFLNVYHLLNRLEKTGKFPILHYYVHRYIRITPQLAAVILITVGWYNLLGTGPMWQKVAGSNKMLCDKYWWSALLYINNYYNPVSQCAGQSWFLAVDMQLYWLAPLAILPCWKWPRIRYYYISFLILLSVAGVFTVSYIDHLRMAFTMSQNIDKYKLVTKEIYVPTHTRATPYITGIMFGLVVQEMRKSKRKLNISQPVIVLGWLLSTALCLTVVLGNYPFMQTADRHPYNRMESSFYISLHRLAWSLGLGWIVVACLSGFGGIINSILGGYIFVPLSRLTYGLFLCQLMVQQYFLGTSRVSEHFSVMQQVHSFFGDLSLSILVSFVLTLMFELPIQTIEKYFLLQKRATTEKAKETQRNAGLAAGIAFTAD